VQYIPYRAPPTVQSKPYRAPTNNATPQKLVPFKAPPGFEYPGPPIRVPATTEWSWWMPDVSTEEGEEPSWENSTEQMEGLGDTFPREESEEERVKNEIESATESFEMPTTDLGNLEASTVTPGPLFQAENLQQTNKESETSTDKKIRPGMDNNKIKPSTDNNKIELEQPVEMGQNQNTNRPSVAAAMQEMFMSSETSEEGTGAEMFMSQETEEEDGDEPKHEIVSMKDKYAELVAHNSRLVEILQTTLQLQTDLFSRILRYLFN